ncbi:MAG: iron-sulfur cluster-binding protein [Dehalococcoidia bacterium]|nr:iron-sulfur cluster-binding protein [Dehalococcoidia bacterium]
METSPADFKKSAVRAIADPRLQKALEAVYNGFYKNRLTAAAATDRWEEQREQGRAIKAHVIGNLDFYLDMLATNVEKNGGRVFFAADVADANAYVLDLAKARGVRTVIKSKSMVSEEMELNHALESVGIEPVETDLGEYIIQLAKEPPYHIIAPAIHKSKEQVADLLAEQSGGTRFERAEDLTRQAREQLRPAFQRADMGVTGVNFAVAESGSIVIVTNEGNGRMATSAPRIHVACMGMEKVIPSVRDLGLFLRILIRSATGQRISTYVSMINGPRKPQDEDGPDEFHLVIIDNGRRRLLADPALRESLYCIRCGACMNACPVYRKAGGHSYGSVYSGPIGAVVTPGMTGKKSANTLPFASSLCGACREACPVKIDLPRMLLELRRQAMEGGAEQPGDVAKLRDDGGGLKQGRDDRKSVQDVSTLAGKQREVSRPGKKSASLADRLMWKAWRFGMTGRGRFDAGARLGRIVLKPFSRRGWVRRGSPFLGGWTVSRDFPLPAERSFKSRWQKRMMGRGVPQ